MNAKEIIKLINEVRKENGYSNYRLSQMTGIKSQYLGQLFSGKIKNPSLSKVLRLCDSLSLLVKVSH